MQDGKTNRLLNKNQSFVNGCSFTNGKSFTNGNSFINGCSPNTNIKMKRKKKITSKHIFPILIMILLICSSIFVPFDKDKQPEEQNDITIDKKKSVVDINGNGDYTLIQDAVDNANPGDTIYVWEGQYDENVTINIPLNLIGNSSTNTTINGTGNDDVVNITSNWVNVSGFNITNSGTGWPDYDSGIKIYQVDNCRISDCNASNNGIGIFLYYSNNNNLMNNTCSDNVALDPPFAYPCGIYLYYSDNNNITNNTSTDPIHLKCSENNNVTNNTCYDEFGGISLSYSNNTDITNNSLDNSAIYLDYSNNNTISYNECLNNVGGSSNNGIDLDYSNNNTIINNICSDNEDNGIHLDYSNNNTITNNTCSGNVDGIYLDYSDTPTITNNTCTGNNYGIVISHSDNSTITNNTYSNNGYGMDLRYSDNTTITDNDCSDNNANGIYLSFSNNTNITDNICTDNNNADGIYLLNSNNTTITTNNCSNNGNDGIRLSGSHNNTITYNNITYNDGYGVELDASSENNTIHHNNFINNNEGGALTLFAEGWESNSWTSPGYVGIWTHTGTAQITSSGTPHTGTYHLTMNGDGVAYGLQATVTHPVDLSGYTFGRITFWWGASSLESSDYGTLDLYYEGTWHNEIRKIENGQDNGVYFQETVYINSSILTADFQIRFSFYGEHGNDFVFVDDISIDYIVQAYDDGNNNWWNDSSEGNYWNDWTAPDIVPPSGIVDDPYVLDGSGGQDEYPLTDETAIPEFSDFIIPMIGMLVMFMIVRKKRKTTEYPSPEEKPE